MGHRVILGNEINILPGFPFDSDMFTEEAGVQLIRIRDLQTFSSNTYYKGSYNSVYVVKAGDILIGMDGDFNIVKWKGGKGLLNQRILKIYQKADGKVEIDYIYYLLQPMLLKINERTPATTVKHLSTYDISTISLEVPPNPVQKKISYILSTIDKQIEETEAIISKYQAIKQGMLQDLFTRGVDVNTGKLRPSHEEAPKLYKKSPLGLIPKEWEVCVLDNCHTHERYSYTGGPFGSSLKAEHYTSHGVRIIQLQNIGDGHFNDTYKIYTSEKKANELFSCNIYPGDIIIAKMADPLARACIVPDFDKRFLMASDGIRLKVDQSLFDTNYVLETINSHYFRSQATLLSTGTTRERIGLTELKNLRLKKPQLKEQRAISDVLRCTEKDISVSQKEFFKLHLLKQGLMNDLLTGKVDVKL